VSGAKGARVLQDWHGFGNPAYPGGPDPA